MRSLAAPGLILEPQLAQHAEAMFAVLSDPAIYEFENAPPPSVEWLRQRFARLESRLSADGAEQWLNWVIRVESGELAGYVQATVRTDGSAGIAYELASRYWGRGLATRAVGAMIDELARAYGVRRLNAVAVRGNHRSLRLLERFGFAVATPAEHADHAVDPAEVLMSRSVDGGKRGVTEHDERVHLAHGDAWQAEGRLRAALGGGAIEWPGARLMASGLPHAQWNSGDLADPARFDLEAVRAWYARRAVPWGMRVPAGAAFPHGRLHKVIRNMALEAAQFVAAPPPAGVQLRRAGADELRVVATIDARAFDEPVEPLLPWIAPHLAAPAFTVALALLDGAPVGVATAVHTDDRAGRCATLFGVGVLEHARGRGIGAAVTGWLVERAFDAGVTLAHLNPNTEDAARVYARLGFAETRALDVYADL